MIAVDVNRSASRRTLRLYSLKIMKMSGALKFINYTNILTAGKLHNVTNTSDIYATTWFYL